MISKEITAEGFLLFTEKIDKIELQNEPIIEP